MGGAEDKVVADGVPGTVCVGVLKELKDGVVDGDAVWLDEGE